MKANGSTNKYMFIGNKFIFKKMLSLTFRINLNYEIIEFVEINFILKDVEKYSIHF